MDTVSKDPNASLIIIGSVAFVIIFVILLLIAKYFYKRLKKYVDKTPGRLDNFILDFFRLPVIWLIFWVLFKIFTVTTLNRFYFSNYISHANNILLIFTIAYILTKFVKAGAYFMQSKLDINQENNLLARKNLTQLKVFQGIINTIIIIVAISISLLTFEKARAIGVSLLTSAGILGIIVGFAAQKSLSMFLAGIQIAITQPIRLDDIVIVEGEWGRIEEINLTYVVIKIWDERRLVLPVNYFLEKPFQNWTRSSSSITGSVFLYVDYNFPVEAIRKNMPLILEGNKNWDARFWNVQITNTSEKYKEIRILVTSADASKNWDLKVELREKLIDLINQNYPNSFAKFRVETFSKKDAEDVNII